ncbi:Serine/threonine-protein phosphatase [Ananas comosus]|uniref:Serine/threonine-protein phosphatase n=1 Tax=Ananas comosus TaxID=4615 RepID=A0A199V580_ANACO|nr:Serine/threonine-protein phosphatase [Ananas comosus]
MYTHFKLGNITWRPYTDAVIDVLPAFCVQDSAVWRSRTTLICFHIVELHVPDRVLRQFGLLQHIPIHVETIRRFTSQGRPDEDWAHFHFAHIERWGQRLQATIDQHPIVGDDPVQATSIYMEWYWQITRRWISRSVQRPPLTYLPRGQTKKALNAPASEVQRKKVEILVFHLKFQFQINQIPNIELDIIHESKGIKQLRINRMRWKIHRLPRRIRVLRAPDRVAEKSESDRPPITQRELTSATGQSKTPIQARHNGSLSVEASSTKFKQLIPNRSS